MSARMEVRALIAAKITSLGQTPLEYRDNDDAVADAERPFTLIQQAGPVEITRQEGFGGTEIHEGSFLLTFAADERDDAEAMMNAAVAAFDADYTLGGKIVLIQAASYGDEDTDARDFAAIMVEFRVMWATAPGDWSALIY